VVICLERGADLHMAQLMPLPLTFSCSSKIQIGFTFLVPAHPGSPRKKAVKRVCVCVCAPATDLFVKCHLKLHIDITLHYTVFAPKHLLTSSSTATGVGRRRRRTQNTRRRMTKQSRTRRNASRKRQSRRAADATDEASGSRSSGRPR